MAAARPYYAPGSMSAAFYDVVTAADARLAGDVDIYAGLPADAAARIELRLGDMTALDLKRTFDAVICPYFTLAHVPAGQAWRNSFASAARHLQAGGLAAFHLPRLELMRQAAQPPDPTGIV